MNKSNSFFLFLFLLTLFCLPDRNLAQGLQFYGNEKRIAERSSLCVFSEEHAQPAVQHLSLSFSYNAQNVESPGYIFYLKDAESDLAYNLTYEYDFADKAGNFRFAQDGKQIYHTTTLPARTIHRNRMEVSIHMDFAQNQASIRIGDDSTFVSDIGLEGNRRKFTPQLFFGMYRHILETASFCLQDLRIACDDKSWSFPLDESRGEDVHDSHGVTTGHVENPVWLINDAYHWKRLYSYHSSSPAGFAFSTSQQLAYIYNRDSLITYDPYQHQAQGNPYDSPTLPVRLGMCFFDEKERCIYAYELNGRDTYIARLEPTTRRWTIINQGNINLQMHHHGAVFSQDCKRFLFFGGYGNRSYYNTFIRYDLATNRWDTLAFEGPSVAPRFFAAMTMAPDGKHAYLYGGKGNEAGDQNVGICYYYDLYRLDLERHSIEKLWEHAAPPEDMVPVREMIPTPDGKWLYLLAYPEYKPQTYLRLYRLSIADGRCEALGDSIPMTSEEIATNANLYYSARLNEFYCVVQEFGKYGDNDTRIYALSAPPVNEAAVHRYDHAEKGSTSAVLWGVVAVLILASCAGIGVLLMRKRRPAQPPTATEPDAAPASPQPQEAGEEEAPEEEKEEKEEPACPEPSVALPDKNRLHLFGPFCAIDHHGRDMSHLFSPKIRHLFLYILINSVLKDGVLSADLNVLFWPDKPEDKIKNLKNVHINHLRKALQDIDGIELVHNQGYYRLQVSDKCFCDFHRFAVLTGNLGRAPERTEEREELVGLLSRGRFLDTVRSELFDYSKQQVEAFVIPFLEQELAQASPAASIRLCKILQTWDPLSEAALRSTIRTYRRCNQYGQALQAYTAFCAEWRQMMGEEYTVRFEDMDDGAKTSSEA